MRQILSRNCLLECNSYSSITLKNGHFFELNPVVFFNGLASYLTSLSFEAGRSGSTKLYEFIFLHFIAPSCSDTLIYLKTSCIATTSLMLQYVCLLLSFLKMGQTLGRVFIEKFSIAMLGKSTTYIINHIAQHPL